MRCRGCARPPGRRRKRPGALQAKRVRKNVPRLAEATGERSGRCSVNGELRSMRLAVVGESTAVGVGATTLDEALPGHLARAIATRTGANVDWTVLGGNGMTAKRVLACVCDQHEKRYDAAVVLLGVNDVFRMTSIRTWLSNLRQLTSALTQHGCRTVLVSAVPPIGQFPALPQPLRSVLGLRATLLDQQLTRLASEIDEVTHCQVSFPKQPACVATDGLHPSALGYRNWAEQLALEIPAMSVP